MSAIGTPMQTAVPSVVQGKPGPSYYTQRRAFDVEVKGYLETPLVSGAPSVLANPCSGGTLNLSGTLNAAEVITAEADIRHGQKSLMLAASAFNAGGTGNATATLSRKTWVGNAGGATSIWGCIPLSIGDRILSVVAYVHGAVGQAVSLAAFKSSFNTATQLGSTQLSASAATDQTLTIAGLTEIVADQTGYLFEVSFSASVAISLYGGKVIYDRP